MTLNIDWLELRAAAQQAASRAYAPYSKFRVGAALLSSSGEIVIGCNVENASYGLTICAERVAVGAAVARGFRSFSAIVIVTEGEEPVMPCGACRQVLAEFSPSFPVHAYGAGLRFVHASTASLLPHAFSKRDLNTP